MSSRDGHDRRSSARRRLSDGKRTQRLWSLDLRALHVFATIAAEHSFRGAAERLQISPASVSQTVAKLERHLGCRLFDRSTRHVGVTIAGTALLDHAHTVLDAAMCLEHTARSLNGHHTLQVGVIHGMYAGLIASAASADAPAVRVSDDGWADPTCGLGRAAADLGMLVGPTDHDTGLVRQAVCTEPVVALVPVSSALADREAVDIDELDTIGWTQVETPDTRWRTFWRLDHLRGAAPPEHPTVHHSPASLLYAVRRSEGIHATVPAFGDLFNLDGLALVPIKNVPPVSIDVAHRNPATTGAVEQFARRIVDAASVVDAGAVR